VHRWRDGHRDGRRSALTLSRLAHDDIVSHARETAPAECCGLLIGTGDAITETARTRNLSADPNRFEIHPEDHIHTRRTARGRGLEVLGFYHSHPRSPATPSATDLAEASYPGHLYVIVSLSVDPADVRLYRHEPTGFREVSWQLDR
jgi:proteasome lid subunit RPN8/RPN11